MSSEDEEDKDPEQGTVHVIIIYSYFTGKLREFYFTEGS